MSNQRRESRSRIAATLDRADTTNSRIPPTAIVLAPIASGFTSVDTKLAAVPVVPHKTDAKTSATVAART
jgi:hypothetical protein